ncbi:MAG: hypothetical protein Q9177_001317, partial [Variospora cf. flavescens]
MWLPSNDTCSDFCDPRDLLVNSTSSSFSTAIADFPPLPILSPSDNEQKLIFDSGPTFPNPDQQFPNSFDTLGLTSLSSLASFDTFSDFESDSDFILSHPSPEESVAYLGNKRQRLDLLSFDEEDLLSEDSLEETGGPEQTAYASLPTPPESRRASDIDSIRMKAKKRSVPKKPASIKAQAVTEAEPTVEGTSPEQNPGQQQTTPTAESNSGSSDNAAIPSSASTPAAGVQPIS